MRITCKSLAIVGIVLGLSASACSRKEIDEAAPSGGSAKAAAAAANEVQTQQEDGGAFVTKRERVMSAPTLDEALKTANGEIAEPALRKSTFEEWASAHLKWADVDVKKNESSTLMALKDPIGAYGKRACISGKVAAIVARRDADGGTVLSYTATMEAGTEVWALAAVGDTGELVRGSPARFCGVALGVTTTKKADGLTADALNMVGLFDLPSNRKR